MCVRTDPPTRTHMMHTTDAYNTRMGRCDWGTAVVEWASVCVCVCD